MPPVAPVQDLLWGRYRLGEVRLSGRFFTFHLAHDTVLRRDVVVKLCRYPADAGRDLSREHAAAKRTAALAHHGIVPLLDIDLERGADGSSELGLVFEHVEGRSLARVLEESGPMTARQAAYLGFDVAEALEYLHTRGVVARGVSPTNIVVLEQFDGRPEARLLDLSNAVAIGAASGADSVTIDGSTDADGAADPADDVLDLGRVVVEALLGEEGDPARAGVPEALSAVLVAMTAADPAARPTSTRVAVALRAFIAGEFGRHRHVAAPDVEAEAEEEARLTALHRYDLLDTPPEGAFDRITGLASRTLGMPVSTVSIVDRDRIWFKSHHGVDGDQIAREPGLCATVVSTGARVAVPDARADESTRHNGLIAGDLALQSYAGVPLTSVDGYTLGALSVADYVPRELTAEELGTLEDLGRMVTHELEMRLAARRAVLSRE